MPMKPRIFVSVRSPGKRNILVSTIETSGFVDSDVELETPRKRKKRQLQYGKLDDEVFMRPSTRFEDEGPADFLFSSSNPNKSWFNLKTNNFEIFQREKEIMEKKIIVKKGIIKKTMEILVTQVPMTVWNI